MDGAKSILLYPEYDATENKNLDINLKTCEIYECKECGHVTKQISEMKKHMRVNDS